MVIMYEVKYWFANGDFSARYFDNNTLALNYAQNECSNFEKVCVYLHCSGRKSCIYKSVN